jgi:hypothetical protein
MKTETAFRSFLHAGVILFRHIVFFPAGGQGILPKMDAPDAKSL